MENLTMPAQRRHPSWRFGIVLAFGIVGASASIGTPCLAQVTPDTTLGAEGSVVTPNANVGGFPADLIEGGATREANLFHSFSEFNVGDGQRVYFANPIGIENILTRVTGNNLSNILGTLGVDGSANLFLLNPNGIIFGQNTRLDVGGSFVATTANSFVFGGGLEFSATNPAVPSLLTVSVPLGLQYGTQPGAITSQGALLVDEGQSLILAGGNITLDNSFLTVNFFEGGRVELGAVAEEGTVGLNVDGSLLSLTFPEELARANVSLANGSIVDVSAEDGGSIAIHAQNIDISAGSQLIAGIASGFGSPESQAGDTTLNATGTLLITGEQSRVLNLVFSDAVGNSGDIRITAGSLLLTDGARLDATTFGQGNGGNILIDARDRVFLDSGADIFNDVEDTGIGAGGTIRISTGLLSVANGASITTSVDGQGDAGDILIDARDRVFLGKDVRIINGIQESGIGNGGNIRINTRTLSLTDDAFISTFTFGQGNAGNVQIEASDRVFLDNGADIWNFGERSNGGNIRISTGTLSIDNGARLDSTTFGQGNAGNVIIEARDQVSLTNNATIANRVGDDASNNDQERATGNGGDIQIHAGSLSVTNSLIGATTFEQGNAGDIFIDVRDRISLNNGGIANQVEEQATGNGGTIRISTGALTATNLGRVQALTLGQGNAGSVIINARDRILFEGGIVDGVRSGAGSAVGEGAVGNGGNIEITTGSLDMLNQAGISASTFGQGNAGNVIIHARDNVSLNNSTIFSIVDENAVGKGGNINITTGSLSLTNGAQLDASTFGQGSSGNIIVTAGDTVSLDGINPKYPDRSSTLFTEVFEGAQGNGGNIQISTGSLVVTNGGQLDAKTRGRGNAGSIFITARDNVLFDGGSSDEKLTRAMSSVEETAIGTGGNITITTGSLTVINGAQLLANTLGQGDAGNVIINASDSVTFDGSRVDADGEIPSAAFSRVNEGGVGNSGNIEITTRSLSVTNGAALVASTEGQGTAGDVLIDARDLVSFEREGAAYSIVGFNAEGNGGNINITTKSLVLIDGGQLVAGTLGQGNAGNVIVDARETVLLDGVGISGFSSGIFTDTRAEARGRGGNITVETSLFRSADGAVVNARTANSERGGDIVINADTFEAVDGGQVVTSTLNSGQAGNITLNVRDNIALSGSDPNFEERRDRVPNRIANEGNGESGLFASTRPDTTGNGGTITLQTNTLSLSDHAQISASSDGTGQAGGVVISADEAVTLTNSDITTSAEQAAGGAIAITTDSLSLNRGRITAATGTSGAEGAANITLQGLDLLLMGNESLISANALNNANGGNVAIDSTLVVATPPEGLEGSDITANASQGNGGRVGINTQGLFGIEFRPKLTPDNDITVSSDFGLAGVFEQNTPGVDPSRGLAELPTDVVDASRQIDRRCSLGGTTQERNSFTVTGRGGLPPSPNDTLQGEAVVTNWVSLDSEVEDSAYSSSTTPSRSAQRQLREAQGWVINEKGEVVLTDQAAIVTPQEGGFQGLQCNAPPENAPPS